jgi:hypothetical protein
MELSSAIWTGAKYDRHLDIVDIARRVRSELLEAQKSGELPKFKLSVKTSRFSNGQSLNVVIKAIPPDFPIWGDPGIKKRLRIEANFGTTHEEGSLSKEMVEVLDKIEMIRGAYNHEEHDYHSDYHYVNFYGGVSIHHSVIGT